MKRIHIHILMLAVLLAAPAAGARVVERVYVSTDRAVYMAGEDIRCSAFCLDFAPGRLYSELSSLAYLELHSADGLAQTAKIALVHGRGAGVISLPRTLPTGNYRIIAYTAENKQEEGYDYGLSARTVSVFNPYLSERVKGGVEIVGAEEYAARTAPAEDSAGTGGVQITAPVGAERGGSAALTLALAGGAGVQPLAGRFRGAEEGVSRPPRILAGMCADVGGHAVHLHIGDRPFNGLVFVGRNQLDIQSIAAQELPDAVFLEVIEGVALLELCNEGEDVFPATSKQEMYMVGHQDEGQDDHFRMQGGLDGDIIHGDLEIFFVPEPKTVFQVVA
ncbi:MAG: hypothetical protein J6W83_04255 [Bacteroidales bacterium]|nr:hypothetical protein [Bacteroidales bacterium]